MMNRILHSWSFQMMFMKLAEGLFHIYGMTTRVRSYIYHGLSAHTGDNPRAARG